MKRLIILLAIVGILLTVGFGVVYKTDLAPDVYFGERLSGVYGYTNELGEIVIGIVIRNSMFELPLTLSLSEALAADVIVTITVRDAYVAQLAAMIQDKYMHPGNYSCTNLTVTECFKKMSVREAIRKEYRQWKYAQDMKSATDSVAPQNIEVEVE